MSDFETKATIRNKIDLGTAPWADLLLRLDSSHLSQEADNTCQSEESMRRHQVMEEPRPRIFLRLPSIRTPDLS